MMTLIKRVKNILLQPKAEWQVIEKESTTAADLYKGYIIPLAAIGPVAGLIGVLLFRVPLEMKKMGATLTQTVLLFILINVMTYILSLNLVYILAFLIDLLAPTFSGEKNRIQALKAAAYSTTAVSVIGILGLIPSLSVLEWLGLYSLYLLFLGLPVLMKAPEEKALRYTAVVVIAWTLTLVPIVYVYLWLIGAGMGLIILMSK
jgi:hypothetical protein